MSYVLRPYKIETYEFQENNPFIRNIENALNIIEEQVEIHNDPNITPTNRYITRGVIRSWQYRLGGYITQAILWEQKHEYIYRYSYGITFVVHSTNTNPNYKSVIGQGWSEEEDEKFAEKVRLKTFEKVKDLCDGYNPFSWGAGETTESDTWEQLPRKGLEHLIGMIEVRDEVRDRGEWETDLREYYKELL